jgi:hypothetical protein
VRQLRRLDEVGLLALNIVHDRLFPWIYKVIHIDNRFDSSEDSIDRNENELATDMYRYIAQNKAIIYEL